ncbi:hypothetical protein [Pseudosulfitobacter koreensis]|uniref:Uncharacterized protein n=1 Tax=Pseudosulfitobacter koreensis TaxID=2968472 RepID=A0ABT1Z2M4_9RHOB|nr:hypothetical protein [Pseudosulfitobacter koreense]MCR8827387.1 hypothetical protein [Pseudosulfitobacter koreense]
MRAFVLLAAFASLAACTRGASPDAPEGRVSNVRQQPSVTEPGLHISGSASVGVVKTF